MKITSTVRIEFWSLDKYNPTINNVPLARVCTQSAFVLRQGPGAKMDAAEGARLKDRLRVVAQLPITQVRAKLPAAAFRTQLVTTIRQHQVLDLTY
jgi:hypothetical protein